jgi:hypothetical protein
MLDPKLVASLLGALRAMSVHISKPFDQQSSFSERDDLAFKEVFSIRSVVSSVSLYVSRLWATLASCQEQRLFAVAAEGVGLNLFQHFCDCLGAKYQRLSSNVQRP